VIIHAGYGMVTSRSIFDLYGSCDHFASGAKNALFCAWCFCTCDLTSAGVEGQEKYAAVFLEIGKRLKRLRKERGLSQEDMLSFGFSTRHWQQMEAGRPITLTTLFRVCDVFGIAPEALLKGVYGSTHPE
jgi:DNA-binding XRE family transcriptional regulator